MFITTLGCNRVFGEGHIDTEKGIFGVLDEKLKLVKIETIIPAKANTYCKCRTKARCNIDCKHAVHSIVSGSKFSPRNLEKRM